MMINWLKVCCQWNKRSYEVMKWVVIAFDYRNDYVLRQIFVRIELKKVFVLTIIRIKIKV